MYFKQILNDVCGCSSYVIASRQSREAVIVDPALDYQQYIELGEERGYVIKYVIDTHIHADHISGNRKLASATGAELCLHESADVDFPFRGLRDNEELHVGQLILRILHTPGHRPEAISITVTNPPRGDVPGMVLSGDTLFVGDVGRPDFGGAEGASDQYRSVRRLLELDDFVEVFPAHFEGSCGKGMCGRPSSTIGFERRFNPWTSLSETEFVERGSEMPGRPLNMLAILATNQGRADLEWAEPCREGDAPTIEAADAPAWIAQHQPWILDVRESSEFQAGHLPGAHLVPQAEIATRLSEIPKDRAILTVCASGLRASNSARYLKHMGYTDIVNLEGGTNAWREAGQAVEGEGVPAA